MKQKLLGLSLLGVMVAAFALIHCGSQTLTTCSDSDNDGYLNLDCGGTDCNDNDANINPGMQENCTDGIDNNCDGKTDVDDPQCACGKLNEACCATGQPCVSTALSCQAGTCKVDNTCNGLTKCGDKCVDTKTDPANCSKCGQACPVATPICANSTCGTSCTGATPDLCGTVCTDKKTDKNNCGTCGKICDAGQKCQDSNCVKDCGNDTLCGTTCTNTNTDPNNCGGCGKPACTGATPVCSNGTCAASCSNPTPDLCGTTCTDKKTDKNNCGTCGNVCSGATPSCVNGSCGAASCGHNGETCCTGNTCADNSMICLASQGKCWTAAALCAGGATEYPSGSGKHWSTCANTSSVLINCIGTPAFAQCSCVGAGLGYNDYCPGQCGTDGKPCCANTTNPPSQWGCPAASNNNCPSDKICHGTTCGGSGQPCCTTGPQCTGSLTCQSGTCQAACGGSGQPCCTTSPQCTGSLTCQGGTCGEVTCRTEGQTCTGTGAGNCCTSPRMNCNTTCAQCGDSTEPCCTSGAQCSGTLTCQSGTCQGASTCDHVNDDCCAGSPKTCINGLDCDLTTSKCVDCIPLGNGCVTNQDSTCCPGPSAGWCRNSKCCKVENAQGCTTAADCCDSANVCTGGYCKPNCDHVGDPCCGSTCLNGLSCQGGTCQSCNSAQQACGSPSNCCPGTQCSPNTGDCCVPNNSACDVSPDCCTDNGYPYQCATSYGEHRCCLVQGQYCPDSYSCCDVNVCKSDGMCGACQGEGTSCGTNVDCCGAMQCPSNSKKHCCYPSTGYNCSSDAGCCPPNVCQAGVCAYYCRPPRNTCAYDGQCCATAGGRAIYCNDGMCCNKWVIGYWGCDTHNDCCPGYHCDSFNTCNPGDP